MWYNFIGDTMKKFLILLCLVLLLSSCGKKKEDNKVDVESNDNVVLEKIDSSKDYVYFESYKDYLLPDGSFYSLVKPVVNYTSDSARNVELEIKTFLNNSVKNFNVINDVFNTGNVIKYYYYETSSYFTLIVNYTYLVDGIYGESKDYVYVFDLNTGNVLSNEEVLKASGNDSLDKLLEDKIVSDDILFTIMTIKSNDYHLYFNNENQLCIIYYEIDNLDNIRKELVL